jgi:oxidoreductase
MATSAPAAAAVAAYTALVVGSTGAVGRDVVAELVASATCAKVIALTRREIPQDQWATSFPAMDSAAAQGKLEIRPVDFDSLSESDIKQDDKIDAAFCCLGTTRKGGRHCGLREGAEGVAFY